MTIDFRFIGMGAFGNCKNQVQIIKDVRLFHNELFFWIMLA